MPDQTPTTRAEIRSRRSRVGSILTPAVRRWAYGVAAAAVGVAVFAGWLKPEAAPVVAPLLMALFYVDKTGQPRQ